jgi:hypothetical protein
MPPDVMLTWNVSGIADAVVTTGLHKPEDVTEPMKSMEPDALALVNTSGSGTIIVAVTVAGRTKSAIANRRAIRNLAPDCGSMVPPSI